MEEIEVELAKLGYNGTISEKSFEIGNPNLDFAEIIAWLSLQLAAVYDLENQVTPLSDLKDLLGFWVEVSCILKELACPYRSLIIGDITERLLSTPEKLLLIRFLSTELQTARILAAKKLQPLKAMQIELEESSTAKELRKTLMSLKFGKPPDSITPRQLFGEVEKRLKTLSLPSSPQEKVGDLLFSGCLAEKQWFQLDSLYKEMYKEYETRRKLLKTRLEVTVRSFLWAEGLKNKVEDVVCRYDKRKTGLLIEPELKISYILSAKSGLAMVEKTSSASVRKTTQSSITKIVIGSVPDRGGRPEEQQPPPPEVPSWQKNDSSRSYQQPENLKNAGHENSNNRNKNSNIYKDNLRENLTRNKTPQNTVQSPFYQPMNNYSQISNQQLQFGGYERAGDNFHQYGMPANYQYQQYGNTDPMQMNRSRGGSHRSNNWSRGGSSTRGYNPQEGYKGRGNRFC